jgi:hypothetical protein
MAAHQAVKWKAKRLKSEIYGSSLTLNHILGVVDGAYVSRETPMLMYLNLHAALDQMREKTKKNPSLTGPRVCN